MTIIVSIEAPLGGGKGFFLKYCRQHAFSGMDVTVSLQDDSIAHVIDMNADPNRWALFTELDFLFRHVQAIHSTQSNSAHTPDMLLVEGSPLTDRVCYMHDTAAGIDPLDLKLYDIWYDVLLPYWKVDMHVRLKSSIHSHYDRVIGNSKKEQSFVTLGYLAHKGQLFDACLHGCPIMTCENNFEDNEPVLEVMKAMIERMLRMLKHTIKSS